MAIKSPAVHLGDTRLRPRRTPRNWRAFGITACVTLTIAACVSAAVHVNSGRYGSAVRDVLAVARSGDSLPFYAGWLTYVGVLAWIASAACSAFAAQLVWDRRRREGSLLLGFGALSALLAVDDLFMLHDGGLKGLGLRVDEQVPMGVLALLGAAWAVTYLFDLVRDPDFPILCLALGLFAYSLVADVVGSSWIHEDAAKLAATLCWVVFAWNRSLRAAADGRSRPSR